MAQKVQGVPGAVVEIAGFTDTTGSPSYNLVLSRKRAESVQRYLAKQNVSVAAIHIIGFGEDTPPAALQADTSPPNASKAEINQMARRVRVQILGPSGGTAARSQQ